MEDVPVYTSVTITFFVRLWSLEHELSPARSTSNGAASGTAHVPHSSQSQFYEVLNAAR